MDREETCIFPVILAVSEKDRQVDRRQRAGVLSRLARRALGVCARKSGVELGELEKDENGAPLPSNGNYWSLTHKPDYVGAVIGPASMGIDIEGIRDVSSGLIQKAARESEWRLAGVESETMFFRYWTAKEAVLKAAGVGISGLSKCRVTAVPGERHLYLYYEGGDYLVEHFFFDRHVASVVKNRFQVEWSLENQI